MRALKDGLQPERMDSSTEVMPGTPCLQGMTGLSGAMTRPTFGIFILELSTMLAFSVLSPLLLSLYLHKYGHFVFDKGVKTIPRRKSRQVKQQRLNDWTAECKKDEP